MSSIPLSQFKPANFTGLPDSHQPAAWLAPAHAKSPKESVVVSRAFVIVIVTLPNMMITAQEKYFTTIKKDKIISPDESPRKKL
ncbi:hypothetical protein [Pseudomonas tructae]|uniref:hypothetical protein n=1 Tax=Pseudomonas tructae TaxID=2518644 RepID=UPI001E4B953F|nr:hypothetical protein [Pseudomonas tructae]